MEKKESTGNKIKAEEKEEKTTENQIGTDCYGEQKFQNIEEMWKQQNLHDGNKEAEKQWYQKGNEFWKQQSASVDGVLCGNADLNTPDILHSEVFLNTLIKQHQLKQGRVLDCGAGVGRITKNLLIRYFQTCDLCDQCEKFIEEAKQSLQKKKNAGHFIVSGLQNLKLTEKYDLIWIQWVLNQLIDKDLINLFELLKNSLNPNGIIVVKENISVKKFVLDVQDFSVTRSEEMYKGFFEQCKLKVIEESWQTNFPSDFFPPKAFALCPIQ